MSPIRSPSGTECEQAEGFVVVETDLTEPTDLTELADLAELTELPPPPSNQNSLTTTQSHLLTKKLLYEYLTKKSTVSGVSKRVPEPTSLFSEPTELLTELTELTDLPPPPSNL